MAQVLNGYTQLNNPESFSPLVGVWRTTTGNWNFTDDGGGIGTYTIFNVVGTVLIQTVGICNALLDSGGAAKIELGIAGNTAALIAQTTATELDQYETWQDAVPEANPGAILLITNTFIIAGGADVIFTVSAAALTAGDIDFMCLWIPITINGSVIKV